MLSAELNETAEQMGSQVRGVLPAAYSQQPVVGAKAHAAHDSAMNRFKKSLTETEPLVDGENEKRVELVLAEHLEKWKPAVRRSEKSCADHDLKEAGRIRAEVLGPPPA